MANQEDSERRRIVLHPRTAAARRVDRRRTYGSHVRGFSVQNDDVFELVATQRRSAIRYLIILFGSIAVALIALVVVPDLSEWTLRGVPLPWILFGPVLLFSIVVLAWRHDRASLRVERAWADEHKPEDRSGDLP